MLRILSILVIASLFAVSAPAQPLESLSLHEAYQMLDSNYPILKNSGVLEEIYNSELDQLDKNKLPQLYLKADGRIQSESVKLETEGVMLPIEIDQPWYSAKAYAEVQYNILNGKTTKAQRILKSAGLEAEQQALEVDRYALRERINQLFLGILSIRDQTVLIDLSRNGLVARKEQAEAGVENGVLLESELKQLEVKELELQAMQESLGHQIAGLINTLSDLTGVELAEELELQLPNLPDPLSIPEIQRPEKGLFAAQRNAILAQSDLLDAARLPQFAAYAQGGIGYPNPLNLLDNGFAPYGILGMQFSWKITDWGKRKTNKEILNLQAKQLEHAEETFDFNVESGKANYLAEVERLNALILRDEAIADLQAEILEQFAAQLDEGVITSSDYVTQLNTELAARQKLSIHKTELLKVQLDFLNQRGSINLGN